MNTLLEKPVKVRGAFDVTRQISLLTCPHEKLQEAMRKLVSVQPVLDARVDRHDRISVSYDASSIGMHNIEILLDELGLQRKNDFWWKLKSAWFDYVDENAQANARANGGACCNRPPSVNGIGEVSKLKQWHIHE